MAQDITTSCKINTRSLPNGTLEVFLEGKRGNTVIRELFVMPDCAATTHFEEHLARFAAQ